MPNDVQLCQAGGENPHCFREAVGFLGGANWCQFHYDKMEKMFEDTQMELEKLAKQLSAPKSSNDFL